MNNVGMTSSEITGVLEPDFDREHLFNAGIESRSSPDDARWYSGAY